MIAQSTLVIHLTLSILALNRRNVDGNSCIPKSAYVPSAPGRSKSTGLLPFGLEPLNSGLLR